jgi:ABC-type nickel/cobalt efflux system permease component RcnA
MTLRNLSEVQVNNNDNLSTISSIGLLLGVIHVLTGVDHLSAVSLITLNKKLKESFLSGITWGFGHCIGLSIVAAIFFGLNDKYSFLENNTFVADKIVGFFMTSLGCYGFYNTRKMYLTFRENDLKPAAICVQDTNDILQIEYDGRSATEEKETETNTDDGITIANDKYTSSSDIESYSHDHSHDVNGLVYEHSHGEEEVSLAYEHSHTHDHYHENKQKNTTCYSILIGVVHGISGTGAVLGILPAVTLRDGTKTTVYLVSFFSSSILSMGAYAIAWNRIHYYVKDASKIRLYNFYSQLAMSSVTFCVGILWIAVSFTVGLDYYGL